MIAGIVTPLHVVRAGRGPRLLLVHGSAADHTMWSIQLAGALRERFELVAYDRREDAASVEDHACDAAALIAAEPGRATVVGSSFGAVVALELARARPELCAGLVLIEPPMPATEDPPDTREFLAQLDALAAAHGGPAAGERFLRAVLGDTGFERMPKSFRERAAAKWPAIRADFVALAAYRPRYAELARVTTPVLLVAGARSVPYFRPTLEALRAVLPAARLEIVPDAGHMLHAEAPRRFGQLVEEFAAGLAYSG